MKDFVQKFLRPYGLYLAVGLIILVTVLAFVLPFVPMNGRHFVTLNKFVSEWGKYASNAPIVMMSRCLYVSAAFAAVTLFYRSRILLALSTSLTLSYTLFLVSTIGKYSGLVYLMLLLCLAAIACAVVALKRMGEEEVQNNFLTRLQKGMLSNPLTYSILYLVLGLIGLNWIMLIVLYVQGGKDLEQATPDGTLKGKCAAWAQADIILLLLALTTIPSVVTVFML